MIRLGGLHGPKAHKLFRGPWREPGELDRPRIRPKIIDKLMISGRIRGRCRSGSLLGPLRLGWSGSHTTRASELRPGQSGRAQVPDGPAATNFGILGDPHGWCCIHGQGTRIPNIPKIPILEFSEFSESACLDRVCNTNHVDPENSEIGQFRNSWNCYPQVLSAPVDPGPVFGRGCL